MLRFLSHPSGALRAPLLGLALALLGGPAGCVKPVDRITIDRVFARAALQADLDRGCTVGLALGSPVEAVTSASRPPKRAVVVADAAAALCAEDEVREAQLASARLEANLQGLAPAAQVALIRDARAVEERAHALAAARNLRAWGAMEAVWGPLGGATCPRVRPADEVAFLLGLNAGLNALLHDRAAGGDLGVPLDILPRIARASECLDDGRWWSAPLAMRAAVWATVPGSAPDGVDPWALLDRAAEAGDAQGVRLARALQAVIASNNGRPDVVRHAVHSFARSRAEVPPHPEYALFDDYAHVLVRHESDLLWTRAAGHRTLQLGALPGDAAQDAAPGPAEDPFASAGDPFAVGGGSNHQEDAP